MNITDFYKRKIDEEMRCLKHERGPLRRIVSMDEISPGVFGVCDDFAGDNKFCINREGTILHKYEDRVLLLVTEKCVSNCAYCFRKNKLSDSVINYEKLLVELDMYLLNHKEVKEVIISGGDFMTLNYNVIESVLKKIAEANINNIRMHTRAIVYQPSLFSEDIIKLLKAYNVRLYFHIVHPYEVCDVVVKKIKEISRDVRCYNQFPLLRGINDNVNVLKQLIKILDELRVITTVIYVADPLGFLEQYRVPIKKCLEIKHIFEETSPSWMNALRMVFDSAYGKVNVDRFIGKDDERNICYFEHKGEIVEFPDLPEMVYVNSDESDLLWKD